MLTVKFHVMFYKIVISYNFIRIKSRLKEPYSMVKALFYNINIIDHELFEIISMVIMNCYRYFFSDYSPYNFIPIIFKRLPRLCPYFEALFIFRKCLNESIVLYLGFFTSCHLTMTHNPILLRN